MLRGNGCGLLLGRCDESAPGQVVGFPEETSGTLMDSSDGGLIEEVLLYPGDGEMMPEIVLHVLAIDPIQVASGHDAGCQRRLRGAEESCR